eukprot:TRINITY_DN507_c0_g2_i1.p1 TRINITY_DN507_c0_g2~~TRINITY_DN507_c0_g2_i1.p1  ORF type:complete len:997 (+),score=217.60 TRINITY_DN507_c0_g2_i1:118-3108(+)
MPNMLDLCEDAQSVQTHDTRTPVGDRTLGTPVPPQLPADPITLQTVHAAQVKTQKDVAALSGAIDKILQLLCEAQRPTHVLSSHALGQQSRPTSHTDLPKPQSYASMQQVQSQHIQETPIDGSLNFSTLMDDNQSMAGRPIRNPRAKREAARLKALAKFEVEHQTPGAKSLSPAGPPRGARGEHFHLTARSSNASALQAMPSPSFPDGDRHEDSLLSTARQPTALNQGSVDPARPTSSQAQRQVAACPSGSFNFQRSALDRDQSVSSALAVGTGGTGLEASWSIQQLHLGGPGGGASAGSGVVSPEASSRSSAEVRSRHSGATAFSRGSAPPQPPPDALHVTHRRSAVERRRVSVLGPLQQEDEDDAGDEEDGESARPTRRPLLLPTTPLRVGLEALLYATIAVETLLSTYYIAAGGDAMGEEFKIFICATVPLLPFWIVLNLNTVTVKDWQLYDTRPAIRRHYMWSFFVPDAILSIPFDVIMSFLHPIGLRAALLLRVARAIVIPRLFRTNDLNNQRPVWVHALIRGYFWVLIAHIAACSWLGIADLSEQGLVPGNAAEKLTEADVDRFHQYIASIYWSVATLTSTGYGDISAYSPEARGLSLFWMCFGVLIIIFTGAKLTEMMVVTDPFALAEMDKKRKLCSLMNKHNIPWSVQKSALRVFPVVLDATCQNYSSIIADLPQFLQEEIRLHIKLQLFSKVALFKGLSIDALKAVVQVTVPEEYQADVNIVQHGERGTEMFFLEQGLVEVYTYDDCGREVWIANLKSGSHFGESALMSNHCKRTATVRAVTDCALYALLKPSFDRVADAYPELTKMIWRERSARLRLQGGGEYWTTMLQKTVVLQLYCTPRPTDSPARVRWRLAVRRIIEGRCEMLMDAAEEEHYRSVQARTNSTVIPVRPSLRRRKRSEQPVEGTFLEQLEMTPAEDPSVDEAENMARRRDSLKRAITDYKFGAKDTTPAATPAETELFGKKPKTSAVQFHGLVVPPRSPPRSLS